MNIIIAPTDFSASADNAALFAAGLASRTGSELVLFHAYNVPIPSTEVPVFTLPPQEIRRDCIERLKGVKEKLEEKFPGLKIELMASPGFPVGEILTYAKKRKAGMIVMGLRKRTRKLGEMLGSVATDVMRKAGCEVMIIPEGASFKEPSSILFAYDYNAPLPENVASAIKKYVKLFDARLMVVDVVDPVGIPGLQTAVAGVKLENTLSGLVHDAYFPPGEDKGAELAAFMTTHPTGWLMMMPHSYNTLEKLFHHSITKEMAFHTNVPLLSLHE